jgi:hypothetical protein
MTDPNRDPELAAAARLIDVLEGLGDTAAAARLVRFLHDRYGTAAPTVDPLALIDATQQYAEQLTGAVAVLTGQGWDEPQARAIIVATIIRGATQP